MTKIFIATPAFDGKVHVQYAISLAETKVLLEKNNIEVVFSINTSGSLLVAERNRLLEAFIKSDCTHILCIDSDLGFPHVAVKALLEHDKDFVAGVYPMRGNDKQFIFRPVTKEDDSLVISERNLLKMNYIPAGFMLIKRNVIEKMREKFPELYYEPKKKDMLNPDPGFALFNTELWDGEFWGEDFVFCRRVREAGFEIWVDPFIEFDHAGNRGMLTSVLVNKGKENEQESAI